MKSFFFFFVVKVKRAHEMKGLRVPSWYLNNSYIFCLFCSSTLCLFSRYCTKKAYNSSSRAYAQVSAPVTYATYLYKGNELL